MTTPHPVPLLDLAPKRKTPLSLWNPLDYLLLLYWVFFFPQAIRWYVETFGKVEYKWDHRGWLGVLQLLRDDSVQRDLWVQGLLLTLLAAFGINLLIQSLGLSINWFGALLGALFGVGLGVWFGVMYNVARDTALSASGVAFGVAVGVAFSVALGLMLSGVYLGVLLGVVETKTSMFEVVTLSVLGMIIVMIGVVLGVWGCVLAGVAVEVMQFMAIRWLDFLIVYVPTLITSQNPSRPYLIASHITSLALPGLQKWLKIGLQNDPTTSINNIDQLLRYSLQFIPVIQALNDWLPSLPEIQLYRQVNALAAMPYDWNMIRFGSASLVAMIEREIVGSSASFVPKTGRVKIKRRFPLRTDTPARAACAGYWLMHKKNTIRAMDAFSHNRHILHGETLYQTARVLDFGCNAQNLQNVVAWEAESNWLDHLSEEPLRPQTIDTLRRLRGVSREASVASVSYSKLNRSAALGRAVSTLT